MAHFAVLTETSGKVFAVNPEQIKMLRLSDDKQGAYVIIITDAGITASVRGDLESVIKQLQTHWREGIPRSRGPACKRSRLRWCARQVSNLQPLPSEGSTLSIELRAQRPQFYRGPSARPPSASGRARGRPYNFGLGANRFLAAADAASSRHSTCLSRTR